jgi:amidophosphoribosyltransferase
MSTIREKCGIFGVYNGSDAARLTFFGLYALQHRGQEGSGIAAANGKKILVHKGKGLVAHVYEEEDLQKLDGCHIAVGHNRYGTSGGVSIEHIQPVSRHPEMVLAHNGNLPSINKLQDFLSDKVAIIDELNDSELMYEAIYYFYRQSGSLSGAVFNAFPYFKGAFSLLVMSRDELVAVRDEYGIRPLSLGEYADNHYVVSSETCAINTVQAKQVRDVKPGEMVVINKDGLRSVQIAESKQKLDVFEFVYFARPESYLLGKRVNEVRREFGKRLAQMKKIDADVVIPVPDSAIPSAEGYSEASGIPFRNALIKNRYIGRTFITPGEHLRGSMADMKYNTVSEVIEGKNVILVDDSIVRMNTAPKLVKRLRDAGAKKVHIMVSSSPIHFPDFYGIDLAKQKEIVAAYHSVEDICEMTGADSLTYLAFDEMIDAVGVPLDMLYTGCFTGDYPIDLGERWSEVDLEVKKRLEKKVYSPNKVAKGTFLRSWKYSR